MASSDEHAGTNGGGEDHAAIPAKVERMFRQLDVDNSGFIEAAELDELLELLGMADPEARRQEVPKLLAIMDADGDGEITLEEFAKCAVDMGLVEDDMAKMERMSARSRRVAERAWQIFREIDENGSGTIDIQELELILEGLGIQDPFERQQHAKALMHDLDEDGSGEIDEDEFSQAIEDGKFDFVVSEADFLDESVISVREEVTHGREQTYIREGLFDEEEEEEAGVSKPPSGAATPIRSAPRTPGGRRTSVGGRPRGRLSSMGRRPSGPGDEDLDEGQRMVILKDIFEQADSDHSGQIGIKELYDVLQDESLGHAKKFSKEQLQRIMSQVDESGDGELDFEEFVGAFGNLFFEDPNAPPDIVSAELQIIQEERDELKDQLDALERDKRALQASKDKAIEELQKQMQDEQDIASNEIDRLNVRGQILTAENRRLRSQNSQLELDVQELTAALHKATGVKPGTVIYNAGLGDDAGFMDHATEVKMLKQENEQLQTRLQEMLASLTETRSSLDTRERELRQVTTHTEEITTTYSTVVEEYQKLQEQNRYLQAEVEELRARDPEYQFTIQSVSQVSVEDDPRFQRGRQLLAGASGERGFDPVGQDQHAVSLQDYMRLKQECERLSAELDKTKEEWLTAVDGKRMLEDAMSGAKLEYEQHKVQWDAMQAEVQRLQAQNKQMTALAEQWGQDRDALLAEMEIYKRTMSEKRQERAMSPERPSGVLVRHETLESALAEVRFLKQQLEDTENTVITLEGEKRELELQVQALALEVQESSGALALRDVQAELELAAQQKEIQQLQQQLRAQTEKAAKQNADSRANLLALRAQVQDIIASVGPVEHLEADLAAEKVRAEHLEADCASEKERARQLEQELAEIQQASHTTIEELRAKLVLLEDSAVHADFQNRSLDSQQAFLQELQQQLSDKKEELTEVRDLLRKTEAESFEAQARLREHEERLRHQAGLLDTTQAEIAELRAQLELAHSDLSFQEERAQSDNEAMMLTEKLRAKANQNIELQEELRHERQKHRDTLHQILLVMKRDVHTQDDEDEESLRQSVLQGVATLQSAPGENEESQRVIKALRDGLINLKAQTKKTIADIEHRDKQIIQQLRDGLVLARQKIQELSSVTRQPVVLQPTAEARELEAQLDVAKSKIEDLAAQNQDLANQNQDLSKQNQGLSEQNQDLFDRLGALTDTLHDANETYGEAQDKYQQILDVVQVLQAENDVLAQQQGSGESEMAVLTADLAAASQKIQFLESRLETSERERQNDMADLKKKLSSANDELARARLNVDRLHHENVRLRTDLEALTMRKLSLPGEIEGSVAPSRIEGLDITEIALQSLDQETERRQGDLQPSLVSVSSTRRTQLNVGGAGSSAPIRTPSRYANVSMQRSSSTAASSAQSIYGAARGPASQTTAPSERSMYSNARSSMPGARSQPTQQQPQRQQQPQSQLQQRQPTRTAAPADRSLYANTRAAATTRPAADRSMYATSMGARTPGRQPPATKQPPARLAPASSETSIYAAPDKQKVVLEGWSDRSHIVPSARAESNVQFFPVTVWPTDASERLQISGPAWFKVSTNVLELLSQDRWRQLQAWPLEHVRRYGIDQGVFSFEVGEVNPSSGVFFLATENMSEVYAAVHAAAQA